MRHRLVTLSYSANDLLVELAAKEKIDPDVLGSLILENAVRERHESARRFAEATAKVLNGGR